MLAGRVSSWITLGSLLLVSCGDERAGLTVELAGPPRNIKFIVHGNCFAGWIHSVPLRIRETSGRTVRIDRFSWEVQDPRTRATLNDSTVEPAGDGVMLSPHGTWEQSTSANLTEPLVGIVLVSGEVRGQDEQGPVNTAFRLETSQATVDDTPLEPGFPCHPER
jgi:hypothetical protein